MNKDLIWNFPVSGKSTKFSSDNNNIDTFADDRLGNLTREIIQNSLDATIDGQITKVEFKRFKTLTSDFPALDSYKKYFELWLSSYKGEKDNKDYLFVKKALATLNREEMEWLRISDFNTTGLWGANTKDHDNPYFTFIHGAGLNSKQSKNSGGSKGTGKNAIFANSLLQTLFISTLTKDNEQTFIGVGFLVSRDLEDDSEDWTQGVGYCVDKNLDPSKNKPLNEIINLDPKFNRLKAGKGTDIYIPAFIVEEDWIKEIVGQVIYSFAPALIDNKLSVRIIDTGLVETVTEINKLTLPELVNLSSSYKGKIQYTAARNIYNALTSNNKKVYTNKMPGFEMKLFMLEDSYIGDNRLYIYRCPTKMFIKYEEISAFCQCTGVLLLEGEELTQRLRSVEDAAHSKWSISKWEKTKYSKEDIELALSTINAFKNKNADNFGNNDLDNESDFEYLIENDWCSADDEHEITKETIKDIGLPLVKPSFSIRNDPSKHSHQKHYKRKSNKVVEDSETYSFVENEGESGGIEESMLPDGFNNGNGGDIHQGGNQGNTSDLPEGEMIYTRKNVETINTRMVSINPKEGIYNLIFSTKSSGIEAEIEINALGSTINDVLPIKILGATLNGWKLKIKRNKILMKKIELNKKYILQVKLDVKTNFIWEVNVSANA